VGVKFYSWYEQRNPDVVRARAQAAEAKGDLKTAVRYYQTTASLLSQQHQSNADAAFAYTAELCMKISREAQYQEDAVRYFQGAMECYRAALQENPRNVAVNETLLEESYQNAQYFPAVLNWKALDDVATKLIVTHDAAKPRLYRAEARLQVAQSSATNVSARDLADIDADLTGDEDEPGGGDGRRVRPHRRSQVGGREGELGHGLSSLTVGSGGRQCNAALMATKSSSSAMSATAM